VAKSAPKLSRAERAALSKLRKAGLYKPRGKAPSADYGKKVLRQAALKDVAEGRAASVKMSAREAKRYKDRYIVKGNRVIVPVPAGGKAYSRRGEVHVKPANEPSRRIPPPGGPLRAARGELWTITVGGNVSASFTTRAAAENFARIHYPKARAAGVPIEIVFMRREQYDAILTAQRERSEARRVAHQQRMRELRAAVRAATRPFR
jgi:hypothetical protein